MKIVLLVLGLCAVSAFAQDVVQVICSQDSITARIQKQVVETAGYEMQDVHMNDQSCQFNAEDDEFFARVISPITSCGTHIIANETHVEFTNSISTVDTGPTYPYGVVVGSQANNRVLSALISCTYRIDLNVSTMFIPNITIIHIQIPDAFGIGEFRAAMAIYTDETYRTPYVRPPILDPDATIYVGVNLIGETSSDIYLLMEECWGTISDDPSASPKYPLIDDGCPVSSSADGLVRVTQNGNGHQGMWNSPVFKFVGEGEDYDNVWLHCDLQLCINSPCEPTCPARRKRRAVGDGTIYGPGDFTDHHIITIGPLTKLKVTTINKNDTQVTYVEYLPENNQASAPSGSWNPAIIAVVGVLGGLALICIILALIAVIVRMRGRSINSGVGLGVENKAYA